MALTQITGSNISTATQALITSLRFFNTNSILVVPSGTTAQRPTSVNLGTIRFNTTLDALEIYNTQFLATPAWNPVGGDTGIDGGNAFIRTNGTSITKDVTIGPTANLDQKFTYGYIIGDDITIDSGITVTIEDGAGLAILDEETPFVAFTPTLTYYETYNITTDGIILNIDAGWDDSYPNTGNAIYDITSNRIHGSLLNGVSFDSGFYQSLVFDGVNDYVSFGQRPSLQLTGDMSIEMWVNINAYPAVWTRVFGTGGGVSGSTFNRTYGLWINSNGQLLYQRYGTNSVNLLPTSVTLRRRVWHHVVATTNGNKHTLYLNGVEIGSVNATGPWIASNERILMGWAGWENYFNGKISTVRVYNKALSEVDVKRNYTTLRPRHGVTTSLLGVTRDTAATSAQAILAANPDAPSGIYWINLPTKGPTKIYCLMDKSFDGGGWMMMLKATRGTTFKYDASFWTQSNTLNPITGLNREDGDAKFDVMNYFSATDMMAIWPDIGNGGSLPQTTLGWTWLEKNFHTSSIVPITFWSTVDRAFKKDAKLFSGWRAGVFSSQVDVRFYGFNWRNNPGWGRVRWGFGWNENGGGLYPGGNMDSDDVSGGIGMSDNFLGYSAGDRISCCNDTTGINRSARVELYIR